MIVVPSGLLATVPNNARARRWVVTAWVLYGDRRVTLEEVAAARAVWDVAPHEYLRPAPAGVTVLTTLLQLERIGFLNAIAPCEGGYSVIRKDAA